MLTGRVQCRIRVCMGGIVPDESVDPANESKVGSGGTPNQIDWTHPRSKVGANAVGTIPVVVIAVLLLAFSIALIVSLIQLWPTYSGSTNVFVGNHVVLGIHVSVNLDINYFLIVVLAGAIGGSLHSLRSIAFYVGERQLRWSWILYYACLPVVASTMAIVFYLVLRGGLISSQASSRNLSPYGVAAVAGMVGLFSDQAAEMLRKVFSNLFSTTPPSSDALKPEV